MLSSNWVFLSLCGWTLFCSYVSADHREFRSLKAAIDLLQNKEVCSELDISDKQRKKLNNYFATIRQRSLRISIGLKSEGTPLYKKSLKLADEFVLEVEKVIKETLLEFQLKRLKQFGRQTQALVHLPSSGLIEADVANSFKLDPMLQPKVHKIDQEVERQIVNLHERYKKEMLELLESRDKRLKELMTDEQKKQFDHEFGEPFSNQLEAFIVSRFWRNRQFQIKQMRRWDQPTKEFREIFRKKLDGLTEEKLKAIRENPSPGTKIIPD